MDKVEPVSEFRALLEELRLQLLAASVHFDIWVQLFPTEQVVDVINQYRGFFQPTREAHLDRFMIKISNVVSNDSRSPSFYRVFKMLDSNPVFASGVDVRSLRKRFKQHKEVIDRINEYRNTRGAHWETQERAQQKPVLFGNSKRMLTEFQDIFNEISGAHSGKVWSFKYSQQSNTVSLMNILKLWRQQKLSGQVLRRRMMRMESEAQLFEQLKELEIEQQKCHEKLLALLPSDDEPRFKGTIGEITAIIEEEEKFHNRRWDIYKKLKGQN